MEKQQHRQKKNRVKMFEKLKHREKVINNLKEQELETQCLTSLKLLKSKIQKNQENFLKYIKDLQNPKSRSYVKKYSVIPNYMASTIKLQDKFESLQHEKFLRKSQENTAVVEEEFFDRMIQKKIKEKSYKKLQIEKIQDNYQRQITLKTCNFNLQGQQKVMIKVFYKLNNIWEETNVEILPCKSFLELKLKSIKLIKKNMSFQQQLDFGFPIDYKIKQYDGGLNIKLSDNLVQTFFDLKESQNITKLEEQAIVLIKKLQQEENEANQELDLAQMKQIIDPNDEKVVLKLECEELNIKNFFLAIDKESKLKEVLANFEHQEYNFLPQKYNIYEKVVLQDIISFEVRYRELSFEVKAESLTSHDLAVKKIQYLDKPQNQHLTQERISFFFSEQFSKNINSNQKVFQNEDQTLYPLNFDIKLLISNKFIPKKLEINKEFIQIYDQRLFSFLGQQIKFKISEIRKLQQKINDTIIIAYIQNNTKKSLILKSRKSNQIKGIIQKNENFFKQHNQYNQYKDQGNTIQNVVYIFPKNWKKATKHFLYLIHFLFYFYFGQISICVSEVQITIFVYLL